MFKNNNILLRTKAKMCGIFAFLGNDISDETLQFYLNKIKHRGPDNTHIKRIDSVFFGFHRLSINGLNSLSDQPMTFDQVTLCCNGEIYNYQELAKEHDIKLISNSDCEIIIRLYRKFGLEKTCQMLDGEFSFLLYDHINKELMAARDILGLRGLFYGFTKTGNIAFASEAKAISFCDTIIPFPPRSFWCESEINAFVPYYSFVPEIITQSEDEICKNIREILTRSVQKRVKMSDRPVGFLLSGGLDSSLCVALGAKCFDNPKDIHTFSIGLKGSPDLKYAQIVANYLGTTHHHVEYTEEDYLKEIPETIKAIESYDVTTVRASNGHRLIAKYISEKTNIKVIISGEVSDELTCGYMAFGAISNPYDLLEESLRMLNNIHYYDTLRSDRAVAYHGLEGRYPFAAKEFIEFYLSIPPELKLFYQKCRIEKYLLRKAFQGLLPDEVLWRRKDGFSDAVSSLDRPTSTIIKEYIEKQVTEEEYQKEKYSSRSKEIYYYRKIFESIYPARSNLIPGQWMPNPKFYGDKIVDPSGRLLDTF